MSERELMQESRVAGAELRLGRYESAVQARLERWQAEGFGRRLWGKDHTVWSARPVPELTDEQLRQVRSLALEKARSLKLSKERATLLADSLVGSLATA